MSLFSQRKGIKPLKKDFQLESIDEQLKNRLWNALQLVIWDKWTDRNIYSDYDEEALRVNNLLDSLWLHYFKLPLDTRPKFKDHSEKNGYLTLRKFFFTANWYDVYDFIEFIVKNISDSWANLLQKICNNFLEDENAAYRIVGKEVIEITDKIEIEAIEDALTISIKSISTHLNRGLELLSDRKEPDFRNSIKESISAVEACCQYIANDSKATLGDALKKIKLSVAIHPALEKGFSAIYGYTNDSSGIRHALEAENETPSYADAKFMLVACSTFVNFLLTKTAETGMKIRKK